MTVCSALFYTAIHRIQGEFTNAESLSKLLLGSELTQGFLAAYKHLLKSGSTLLHLASVPVEGICMFNEGVQA